MNECTLQRWNLQDFFTFFVSSLISTLDAPSIHISLCVHSFTKIVPAFTSPYLFFHFHSSVFPVDRPLEEPWCRACQSAPCWIFIRVWFFLVLLTWPLHSSKTISQSCETLSMCISHCKPKGVYILCYSRSSTRDHTTILVRILWGKSGKWWGRSLYLPREELVAIGAIGDCFFCLFIFTVCSLKKKGDFQEGNE